MGTETKVKIGQKGREEGPSLQRRLGKRKLMALDATCEDIFDKG